MLGVGFHSLALRYGCDLLDAMNSAQSALACLLMSGVLSVSAAPAADAPVPPPRACYWVFLNKGSGRDKLAALAKEDVAKMQQEHVNNLGVLGRQGRAFAAGPLGDDGFIRGTVVLCITNKSEIESCFKADPFVQNDILAVEAYRWAVDPTRFHQAEEPFKLAKHTLAVVKKGKNFRPVPGPLNSMTMVNIIPALKPWFYSGDLAASGPLLEAGDLVGILLFQSEDTTRIRTMLEGDPAVKEGLLTVELHPQLMGAGVLRKPADAVPLPATEPSRD
jgi:uncharacterized protein YciI